MSTFTSTVLVTGGTAGLGFQCALEIARKSPSCRIVLASRTDIKSAAASINETLAQENVVFLALDLANSASIRSFVETWKQKNYPPIQALLLNAALQFPGEIQYTDAGLESTFAITHLGHALLFYLLQPYLETEARVIITSSGTHDPAQKSGLPDAKYTTAERLARPSPEDTKNNGRQRYATSKLVNVMWMYALHRRLTKMTSKKWTVIAFDPGLMPGTGLAREAGPFLIFLWMHVLPHLLPLLRRLISPNIHSPHESGTTLAWLAMSSDVQEVSGVYYEGRKQIKSSMESYDEEKQEELWAWTVKNTAITKTDTRQFEGVA